ncbi:MAG: hypothetical protein ACI8Q1_001691 [Parvicella sp.]|jgi:hypothetical protein
MSRVLYILIIVLFFACKKAEDRPCFKKAGELTTSTITIEPSISHFEINDNIDVTLIEDTSSYLVLTGPKNLLNFIEVSNENNRLIISNKNKCDIFRMGYAIHAELHASTFEYLKLTGYGYITNIDSLNANIEIEATHSVSKLDLTFSCDSIFHKTEAGSIVANFKGIANYLYVYSANQAEFHGEELETKYLHFNNSSISDLYGYATVDALIEINNQGNVIISGNPASISVYGDGTGETTTP